MRIFYISLSCEITDLIAAAIMNNALIAKGMQELSSADSDIAEAFALYGLPAELKHATGFEAFLKIIVNQQLSIKAAASILGRVLLLMDKCTAEQFLAIPFERLREAGMSARKIEYAKGIAEAISNGSFDIDGIQRLNNEDAITEITKLKGLGRWSAEIYLMFSLGRLDIFPADDLALLLSLQKLKKLENRPTAKEAREMLAHWAPWRSVGSLFLWHCYTNFNE